jgi:Fic family protein
MHNSNFTKRLNKIQSSNWQKIAQIEELKGRWIAGVQLNTQILQRLKRSVLITSTGASTRIEGAHLSDDDVEKLMRGISMQKFTDRDKQEVRGYYELLQNVFESWGKVNFSENTIKHFHKELLKHVEKDKLHCGKYKKKENKVHMVNEIGESIGILFDTTPAFLTPKEMQELVEWTNKMLTNTEHHNLIVIGNFIVEFLNIHPFEDGNGRLSRILTNLMLLKEGYLFMPYISHEKLVEDNKADYYMALRKSQKTIKTKNENINPWLDFFLGIILEQAKMAVELLSQENIEKLLSQKQLKVWEYLQSVHVASPGEISKKTKVARSTVSQCIEKLLKLKKIERIGEGRGTRYKIVK